MMRKTRTITASAMFAIFAVAAAPPKKANQGPVMSMELVKTGLYVIYGAGCNSVLRLSGNGLILVDGKQAAAYEALSDQVERVSKQAIRTLILTDGQSCRTGTNADFLKAGTQILAHKSLKREGDSSSPAPAWPTFTFDREFKFDLGGIEVRIVHFDNAESSGNTVVYFPNLKAVAIGDLLESARSGRSSALGELLKLDFDVAIPGTGPLVSRADIQALKTKLDGVTEPKQGQY